jgi:hypothetical protein
MAFSTLKREGAVQRATQTARNHFVETAPFSSQHPDALAGLDDKGKDTHNGLTGSITDRRTRARLLGANIFTAQSPYYLQD